MMAFKRSAEHAPLKRGKNLVIFPGNLLYCDEPIRELLLTIAAKSNSY